LAKGQAASDAVSSDDADIIVAGAVEYEATHNKKLNIDSARGDLSMRMISVDSGEVFFAKTGNKNSPGHSPRAAVAASGKALCAEIKPALAEALGRRFERGHRIKLELRGALTQKRVDQIVAALQKAPRLGRVKLHHFGRKKSTLGLVAKGLDGLGLAVALSEMKLGFEVQEAGADFVRVRVRVRG